MKIILAIVDCSVYYSKFSLSAWQVKKPAGTDFFLFHRSLTPLLSVTFPEIAVAHPVGDDALMSVNLATAVLFAGHQFVPAAFASQLLPLSLVQTRYTQIASFRAVTAYLSLPEERRRNPDSAEILAHAS